MSAVRLIHLSLALLFAGSAHAQGVKDQVYTYRPGFDPALTSLDVHTPSKGTNLPVIVWVHGGSWQKGSKDGIGRSPLIRSFLEREGLVLVSLNFRQWPNVDYSEQCADIAAGLRWVVDNIRKHRGSPGKIFLMGHSSGAHLVSLVASDPRYLNFEALQPAMLRGVIPMDIQAYDIPYAIATADALGWPAARVTLQRIFTTNLWTQRLASPIYHLHPYRRRPPFLVIYATWFQNMPQRISENQSKRFVAAVRRSGGRAELAGYTNEDHSSLVANLGDPQDAPTRRIMAFVRMNLR